MKLHLLKIYSVLIVFFGTSFAANAGVPVWTFTPLTATTVSVPSSGSATVQYSVTNQSTKTHTLSMRPISAITQNTAGGGVCPNPFILAANASCVLSLQIDGSLLSSPITDGPIVCENGASLECYRPAAADVLLITSADALTSANISVLGSPLTLTTNGPTGTLTVTNNSLTVTATNITSDFTGTALDGNVVETGNTCASVPPQTSCTLTYTPGSTTVPQTSFPIQGTNTNTITGDIEIN